MQPMHECTAQPQGANRVLHYIHHPYKHTNGVHSTGQGAKTSKANLQAELGTAPVTALEVVADGVVRTHADPLWDWAVLLGLLGQHALDLKALVRRHVYTANGYVHGWEGLCGSR
eukprot:TRINITY_DN92198_c0_g1_i2.p5 TRINITY_DN92198_c0_g1~~TRINITY_DN92198_c0_g1_i2.p5  ORF type:complete len:115 (-),score=10.09 TRINITY_DN92198_c0_g1_i2:1-345(-)